MRLKLRITTQVRCSRMLPKDTRMTENVMQLLEANACALTRLARTPFHWSTAWYGLPRTVATPFSPRATATCWSGTAVVQSMTDTRLIASPSQLALSAATESLFADYADQFNLNDIGLAMRFTTRRSLT